MAVEALKSGKRKKGNRKLIKNAVAFLVFPLFQLKLILFPPTNPAIAFNAPLREEYARVQVGRSVDDVHLIAYGTSTYTNCTTLERAHEICLRWAGKHGASFAPKKYEFRTLTRSMAAKVDLSSHPIVPKAQSLGCPHTKKT